MFWVPESGFKTAHYIFLPSYLWVVWGPALCLKPASFTFLLFYLGAFDVQSQASRLVILPFYLFFLVVVRGPQSDLSMAHFNFLPLPVGALISRLISQDGPFCLFRFTALPGVSEVHHQDSRRRRLLILYFFLFTWGWSEIHSQVSIWLILPFHLIFLHWVALRSRFRSQDGSFYLFTRGWSELQN